MSEKYRLLLHNWFKELAQIGAEASGGVTRIGYTSEEDSMHYTVVKFAETIGLKTQVDDFGNTFFFFDGVRRERIHLIGSHLDSVPLGGCYDGVAGVLAGLLVMKMAFDEGLQLPVETVAFRCEESSAFDVACVGSSLMLGLLDEEKAKTKKNTAGKSLYELLRHRNPTLIFPSRGNKQMARISDYFELHIEQGRVLEEAGKNIGIVTAIAAPYRFKVFLSGQQDHSGGTPMRLRRDALCGASEVILTVEETAKNFKVIPLVATVGVINNSPNALNTVPGNVELRVDVRGVDDTAILYAVKKIQNGVRAVAARRKLNYQIETIGTYPPVDMNKELQSELARAAEYQEANFMPMYSGAGHDAMRMALFVPAAMLFIPCKLGISHNPTEKADENDIVRGSQVLFAALKNLANM